ncbi:M48 family metallopeptidase [Acinetobacter sp. YH12063]|uniref:tetratricopeptide repeat protein n=1 Tax=Acinetobacter sp. YH12063 TaxID=2601061 RepID=UPI0015D16801|nr:hypothetical protein [Acinetobacter sp. YH12063]
MLLSSILLITMPSWACLNTYVEDFYTSDSQKENQLEEDHDEKLNNFVPRHPSPIDYQAEIDYAVHQIYAGRHDLAIKVLSEIENEHPGLPKMTVNLGTAYELIGNIKLAKRWIAEGMRRDPTIHLGSEWIHLNILEAKTKRATPKYFHEYPLLNVHYGTGYVPDGHWSDQRKPTTAEYDAIREQVSLQISERKNFVSRQDAVMAQLFYELANLEMSQNQPGWYNNFQSSFETNLLIDLARQYGLKKTPYNQKRLQYMAQGNVIEKLWMKIKDFWAIRDNQTGSRFNPDPLVLNGV